MHLKNHVWERKETKQNKKTKQKQKSFYIKKEKKKLKIEQLEIFEQSMKQKKKQKKERNQRNQKKLTGDIRTLFEQKEKNFINLKDSGIMTILNIKVMVIRIETYH